MPINYSYEKNVASSPQHCPGLYCGRYQFENMSWSTCGACPWGTRVNSTAVCVPCEGSPTFYDWLYLGFMFLLSLLMHWVAIDACAKRRNLTLGVLGIHVCALVESVCSAVITLLIMPPRGSLSLNSCNVSKLSDWYTLFHNPNPNYEEWLHCTQEAVYPLYTIVFIYYIISLLLMLLLRPGLSVKLLPDRGRKAIYAAMYAFPFLVLIHAIFGGLLYYSFPYLVIIISLLSNAVHFSCRLIQKPQALLRSSILEMRNLVILCGHCLLLGYGVISITQLENPSKDAALTLLGPLPSIFYILTVKYTDPDKLQMG